MNLNMKKLKILLMTALLLTMGTAAAQDVKTVTDSVKAGMKSGARSPLNYAPNRLARPAEWTNN